MKEIPVAATIIATLIPQIALAHGMTGTREFLVNFWIIAALQIICGIYAFNKSIFLFHLAVSSACLIGFGYLTFGLLGEQTIGLLFYIQMYFFFLIVPFSVSWIYHKKHRRP